MTVFRGSENEILTVLWGLSIRDVIHGEHSNSVEATADLLGKFIQGGARSVATGYLGRFEVVEPAWSLEQDVYGCEHGRACSDVTPEERERFEAMIAAQLALQEDGE